METFPVNALTRTPHDISTGITYAAMLLDRSGSMQGERSLQLLEGAADFLEEMRDLPFRVQMAFDLFSSAGDYDEGTFQPAQEAAYLTEARYRTKGGTAIFDAIHEVIAHVGIYKRPQDRAIISIFTDGEENNSRLHNAADTKALILRKRAEGWIFVFAGPNRSFATSIGIEPKYQMALTGGNIRGVLSELTKTVVQALLPAKGGTICL
jgi:Mg-chelatase subunit ChlD